MRCADSTVLLSRDNRYYTTIKFSESITHTHTLIRASKSYEIFWCSVFFLHSLLTEFLIEKKNEHISKIRDLFILSLHHSLVNFNIKESFKWPKMPKENCKAILSLVQKENTNKIYIFLNVELYIRLIGQFN